MATKQENLRKIFIAFVGVVFVIGMGYGLADMFSTPFSQHIARAEVAVQENRLDDALKELEYAEQKRAQSHKIFALRGQIYRFQDKHELALKSLQQAIQLNKGDAKAQELLALTYISLNQPEPAEKAFEAALALKPMDEFVLTNLGALRVRLKKYDKGKENLLLSMRIAPEYPATHLNLAIMYQELDDIDKAISHFSFYLAKKPDAPQREKIENWLTAHNAPIPGKEKESTPDKSSLNPENATPGAEKASASPEN